MELYPLPDLTDLLQVTFSRVRQYRNERRFGVIIRNGKPVVPALFLDESQSPATLFDAVPGTITVLMDGGMGEAAACEWMVTEHPSLGAAPIEVIRSGGVHRVNQLATLEAF